MAITARTTTLTDDIAVNVHDRLLLIRDEDGISLHEIDPDNTYDDVPVGADIDGQPWTLDMAIGRAGDLVVLDEEDRAAIRRAFAR